MFCLSCVRISVHRDRPFRFGVTACFGLVGMAAPIHLVIHSNELTQAATEGKSSGMTTMLHKVMN